MPGYTDYQAMDAYTARKSGSEIAIVLYESTTPSSPLIGNLAGINASDEFETLPVEEAGEDGTNEIVQGRHSVSFNLNGFWTPEKEDLLPSRQNFIGRSFTAMEVIAGGRPGAGTPVRVYTGCKMSGYTAAHGARGLKTIDLRFSALRRYSGEEWSELAGS